MPRRSPLATGRGDRAPRARPRDLRYRFVRVIMRPAALRALHLRASTPGRAGHCQTQGSRNHSEPLAAVDAFADAFPPRAVCEIPLDCLAQPGLERLAWRPAKFAHDLGCINGVAQVVPGPVR